MHPSILLFAPSVHGGIAEYAFCQAAALQAAGTEVTCLVAPGFLDGRETLFEKVPCLSDPPAPSGLLLVRKFRMLRGLISNWLALAWNILQRRPDLVLLDSYVEYFSPLWVWPHWLLARFLGITYAANLHDPVRDFQVGPSWWHRLSVRLAYKPLDFVLVHQALPKPSPVPSRVRVVQVPHGLYDIGGPPPSATAVRVRWGVKNGQKVFLAFGHVRDGKNLDLAIRALAQVPEAFLVVAGSVASSKDKPFAYYRDLAAASGLASRCRFFEGFVTAAALGSYFAGADFVLLTYTAVFHSQSGVLNLAARALKPVLASAAPGPLLESVGKYQLGVIIRPDSLGAVAAGMRRLLDNPPAPRWEAYEAAASWEANARGVLAAAGIEVERDA